MCGKGGGVCRAFFPVAEGEEGDDLQWDIGHSDRVARSLVTVTEIAGYTANDRTGMGISTN